MITESRFINYLIVIGIISWTILFLVQEEMAIFIVAEDRPVQWMQFWFLVLAAFYGYQIVRGYRFFYEAPLVRSAFLLFLVLAIFIAGEEISWGQRLLHLKTPEFLKGLNTQDEISLHNLKHLQRVRHWSLILFGAVGLFVLMRGDWLKKRWVSLPWRILLPKSDLLMIFTLILLTGLLVEATELFILVSHGSELSERARFIAGRFSEIAELLVDVSAWWYAGQKYHEMRQGLWKGVEP